MCGCNVSIALVVVVRVRVVFVFCFAFGDFYSDVFFYLVDFVFLLFNLVCAWLVVGVGVLVLFGLVFCGFLVWFLL